MKPISEWSDAELRSTWPQFGPPDSLALLAAEVLRLRQMKQSALDAWALCNEGRNATEAVVIDYQATIVRLGAELAAAREELAILKCPGYEGDPRRVRVDQ